MRSTAPSATDRERGQRDAVLLQDLEAGQHLPSLGKATTVEPDNGLRFASGKVDGETECLGCQEQHLRYLHHLAEELPTVLRLNGGGHIVHVCHLSQRMLNRRGARCATNAVACHLDRGQKTTVRERPVEQLLKGTGRDGERDVRWGVARSRSM